MALQIAFKQGAGGALHPDVGAYDSVQVPDVVLHDGADHNPVPVSGLPYRMISKPDNLLTVETVRLQL